MSTELFPFAPDDDTPPEKPRPPQEHDDADNAPAIESSPEPAADTIPADTIPADTMPEDTMPEDTPTADTTPADTESTATAPGDTAPGDTAPGDTAPTDIEPTIPELESRPAAGTWEDDLERLRARFPSARDGSLFCVYKLEQDRDLSLRDIRPEAELRGIALGGRSLHSAKVLLGLATPSKPRRRKQLEIEDVEPEPLPEPSPRPRRSAPSIDVNADSVDDLETALLSAIEEATHERTDRLRDAIRRAIEVLQEGLGED